MILTVFWKDTLPWWKMQYFASKEAKADSLASCAMELNTKLQLRSISKWSSALSLHSFIMHHCNVYIKMQELTKVGLCLHLLFIFVLSRIAERYFLWPWFMQVGWGPWRTARHGGGARLSHLGATMLLMEEAVWWHQHRWGRWVPHGSQLGGTPKQAREVVLVSFWLLRGREFFFQFLHDPTG